MIANQWKRSAPRRTKCAGRLLEVIAAAVLTMAPAYAYQVVQVQQQSESRDPFGRITTEAANIHAVLCNGAGETGGQVYIYQYTHRAGFRAIRPPAWGSPLGGRDFPSFAEAVGVACQGASVVAPPGPAIPGDFSPSDLGSI